VLRSLVTAQSDDGVLIGKLDEHLNARPPDDRPGWHPSELSRGYCPRNLVLVKLGLLRVKVRNDARMQRIFDNGHYFHYRIQKYVREMGLPLRHEKLGDPELDYVCEEVKLRNERVDMRGRADNILAIGPHLYVTDYKSANKHMFDALFKPMESNVKQAWLYLGMLTDMLPADLQTYGLRGLIVYESKNDQALKEFVVPWATEGKAYYDSVVEDLAAVNDAIEAKKPGRVPCTCGKCPSRKDLGI
jgi:hypothetical protein